MRSKEDLFHLIKAMSKTEKRYFTLDAQKSGKKGSKYLDLFQAIKNMEEYEEAKLKKKFPKNLPADKAYLYDAILRSMRDYRSSKSKAAQVKEMILDSKYLYERGLYEQCEVRLKEAEEIAQQLDDHLSTLEVIKEKRQLVWDLRKKDYETEIQRIIDQKEENVSLLNEEFKFLELYDQLSTIVMKKRNLDDNESRNKLREQFQIESLENASLPKSPHALRRFYQCAAIYYNLLGNFDKVHHYYQSVVDWWDENPHFKNEDFSRYIVDISNLLYAWFKKEDYSNFPQLLAKIERDTPKNLHDQSMVFNKLSNYKLLYYINSGATQGIRELVDEIDFGLSQYNINSSRRLLLLFNVVVILFMHDSYEACIEWCERIIRSKKLKERQVNNGIYLLKLFAVYGLDDFEIMENTIRSTHRYFQQKSDDSNTKFEFEVLGYAKKMMNAPENELNQIYRSFKQFLIEAKRNSDYSIRLAGIEDMLLFWVNSKLERRSILQVMTSRA